MEKFPNEHHYDCIVVGSGAAGFNSALQLHRLGMSRIAIVTEGINKGTSRNTGSDKQTYYKLTLAGGESDSVRAMADTLFLGGAMDGDHALVEAALSPQCFFNLVFCGVPFPHNEYGEYVGYKTDHDPRQRATSMGPLTSKTMTEKLQAQVEKEKIPIFDNCQVVQLVTTPGTSTPRIGGLLALDLKALAAGEMEAAWTIFHSNHIVYATGGPARIYGRSVYPVSHNGANGLALEAGAWGRNLTESQYGLASTKFRWNLSGTYQQVLPKYISTDEDGRNSREFLQEYFPSPEKFLQAVFLKGYQWPFDSRKISNFGSSLIDLLVYQETIVKGRRVFLDFRENPTWHGRAFDFSWLEGEAHSYLERSGALFGTPIQRLRHMNEPAIQLYLDNGIDLTSEALEIALCAQHNNGGLAVDCWWETNVNGLFVVGEAAGTHGVYRPGGSALNAGQVGSLRAAQRIAHGHRGGAADEVGIDWVQIQKRQQLAEAWLQGGGGHTVSELRRLVGELMDAHGGPIRTAAGASRALDVLQPLAADPRKAMQLASPGELGEAFHNYDMLITAVTYLGAVADFFHQGGGSRGSYMVCDSEGIKPLDVLDDSFRHRADDGALQSLTQLASFAEGNCSYWWRDVKPLPADEFWFETTWSRYRRNDVFRGC